MKVRKRLAIIFLLSIFTVIAIILTMNAIIKTKRNQEIEKKIEKFMFENEGNYGEYHIGDIEEIEGRISYEYGCSGLYRKNGWKYNCFRRSG